MSDLSFNVEFANSSLAVADSSSSPIDLSFEVTFSNRSLEIDDVSDSSLEQFTIAFGKCFKGNKGDKGDTGQTGDRGPSAVEVSTSQPTDPDVLIWLNPDGDDTIVDDTTTASNKTWSSNKVSSELDGKADSEDIPTKTSDLTNDSGFITSHQSLAAYRTSAEQDVIDAGKVDKVTGKGLSTNDFTTAEKTKLAGLENYDDTELSGRVTTIEGKESGWDSKYSKPSGGIPKTDLASDVQTSLGKADTALQSHQSLADYSTTSQMNSAISAHHDSTKQDKIDSTHKLSYNLLSDTPSIPTKTSDLTNDSGFLTSHQSLSAYRTAAEQDAIHDATKQDVIDAQHKLSYNLLSDTPTIPSVPAISTDISADASSNVKTASPKAVKDYVDGLIISTINTPV